MENEKKSLAKALAKSREKCLKLEESYLELADKFDKVKRDNKKLKAECEKVRDLYCVKM